MSGLRSGRAARPRRGRDRAGRRTGRGGAGRGTRRGRGPAPPAPIRSALVRVVQQGAHARAEGRAGHAARRARPCARPRSGPGCRPRALATTGRAFHIASATVRPKPSARLFCTTTSARRCSALTMMAFSSASSIGSSARCTRRRTRCRQLAPGRLASCEHLGALGIVGHRRHVRAGQHAGAARRRPRRARRTPARTPSRSLSRSQRDTCATSGRVEPQRLLLDRSRARRRPAPVLPSSRSNTARLA